MELEEKFKNGSKATLAIENNTLCYQTTSLNLNPLVVVFHKDLYWAHFYIFNLYKRYAVCHI